MDFLRHVCRVAALLVVFGSALLLGWTGESSAGPLPTTPAAIAALRVGDGVPMTVVADRLCGRSLGGRCTKGRAACTRGTPDDCARWRRWTEACSRCADAFARCRQRVGTRAAYTCDRCVAEHDRCEARARN